MVMSTDDDLIEYQADILEYGIDDFDSYHAKAREDILRKLRTQWWARARNSQMKADSIRTAEQLEMDESLLSESQFTRCAVYRVLAEYALPQLTKWNADGDEDKFQVMMMHYRKKFEEEFNNILLDGVDYDFDDDGTIENAEKQPFHTRRLVR